MDSGKVPYCGISAGLNVSVVKQETSIFNSKKVPLKKLKITRFKIDL